MQFLDPRIDVAFKKLFGSREHKGVTISFLNSVLEYEGDARIISIDFLNNEQPPTVLDKKKNILDVFCTDGAGRQFIIEMQNVWELGFAKRIQWYGTKAYVHQLNAGKPYHDLEPVVVVAITREFKVFPNHNDYKSIYELHERKTCRRDLHDITFAFIELPKFVKKESELVTDEDKWLFLLKEIGSYDHVPEPLAYGEFREACHTLNRFTWSEHAYALYEKNMLDSQSAQKTVSLLEEALKENKEVKQEVERARNEAMLARQDAVLAEQKMKQQYVKKMIVQGFDNAMIESLTGLSCAQIDAIRREN